MKFFNRLGTLMRGARQASGTDNLRSEDIKDEKKLTELIRGIARRISALEAKSQLDATEFEVEVGERGAAVSLAHNYGCPVRYYVTHWAKREGSISPAGLGVPNQGVVARSCAIGTWTNLGTVAPGQTNGTSWRMKTRKPILGIRFIWRGTGSNTVTLKLWNNSTGSLIASTTVSVNNAGIYEGYFTTPITTDLTGVDITTSALCATQMTYNTDTVWKGIVPIEVDNDLRLINQGLFLAGDARPTSSAGAGISYCIEPILGHQRGGPEFVMDPSSTTNVLVLKSYVRGKAVIRVEPSQYGVNA